MSEKISESLDSIAESYSQRVVEHGTTAVAAGWRDLPTQKLRFDQLYQVIDFQNSYTLSDLGSGYGAFVEEMPEEMLSHLKAYYGYDISAEMVKAGEKKFQASEKIHFINGSEIEKRTDYVVASGIFNHHFDADPDGWKSHIVQTIEHMYDMADRAIAFNMMTTYVDFQEDYIHYANPMEMLEICLDKFGRFVSLQHDYNLYEFTIFVKKG